MWALNQRLRSATAAKALGVSRSAAACGPETYMCTHMAIGDNPRYAGMYTAGEEGLAAI